MRASAWKVFSVSLYRNETVSAFWARVLKSCHCLQRTITGGPRMWVGCVGCTVGCGCICDCCDVGVGADVGVGVGAGVSVGGASFVVDSSWIRLLISVCRVASLSSIVSMRGGISPFFVILFVIFASCAMRRSRSFSCCLSTLTIKSIASRASSFRFGLLDNVSASLSREIIMGMYLNKRSAFGNSIVG